MAARFESEEFTFAATRSLASLIGVTACPQGDDPPLKHLIVSPPLRLQRSTPHTKLREASGKEEAFKNSRSLSYRDYYSLHHNIHTQILSDSLLTNTVCILCLLIAMPPGSDGEVLI